PRSRLPASSAMGIAQGFLAHDLEHGGLEGLPLVRWVGGETGELDGEASDVDSIPRRVALVGGVRALEEIGDVIQNVILGERQILLENLVLFVALGEIDPD